MVATEFGIVIDARLEHPENVPELEEIETMPILVTESGIDIDIRAEQR